METGQEKRKFVRLNLLVDVIYKKVPASGKLALTKNISAGGICLIIYEELKESDTLDLKIYLPEDKTPIEAKGRVVWVKEFIVGDMPEGRRFDTGIEFIEINGKDIEKVNKCVFSHL